MPPKNQAPPKPKRAPRVVPAEENLDEDSDISTMSEDLSEEEEELPPPLPPKKKAASKSRWDQLAKTPHSSPIDSAKAPRVNAASEESPRTKELRDRIFPTLYAIFQQSRGRTSTLKIKNRTLRSLTRSCLYHKREDQLQRTLEDAEALFSKYCGSKPV
ncbi:33K [Tree shrew adenovirus 1]|uniref:33K n=1 Tax=Tree shrew adenovirus serotype 1 TaxID=47680 RepID=A0A2U9AGA2_ADET1|nr:33K [Tree shrew adenovirus 1]